MNKEFRRNFRVVTIAHLAVVALLLLSTGFRAMFRKKVEPVRALEFLVNVVQEEPKKQTAVLREPERSPPVPPPKKDIPELEPKPIPKPKTPSPPKEKPKPKPEEKPTPERKTPVKVSTKKITRTVTAAEPPPGKRLTPEEIRRLLEAGGKPSDRTVIPDSEDQRCYALIHDAFYDVWAQPSKEDAGDRVVVAAIRLLADGTIGARNIIQRSGNSAFDESVRQALQAVRRVEHLTPDFIRRHPEVQIEFRVE